MYWVVFQNDMALCVCTSQAQADLDVKARKEAYRAEIERQLAGAAKYMLQSALDRVYFHCNAVPASKII